MGNEQEEGGETEADDCITGRKKNDLRARGGLGEKGREKA